MKKIYIMAMLSSITVGMAAQTPYDAANFATEDLNGTARYIGMGGALSALGGDVSVMSVNPAGIAMFKRNDASLTVSSVFSGDHAMGHDKTRASIDNLGAVFALNVDDSGTGLQYVNIGLNYKKNRNFLSNLNTSVNGILDFSQTCQIADLANEAYDNDNWNGYLANFGAPLFYDDQVTLKHGGIVYRDVTVDPNTGEEVFNGYRGTHPDGANYSRATYGSQSQFDIDVSFNISNGLFLGVALGIYNLDYTRESKYSEYGSDLEYTINNWYSTSGQGVDLKFGGIFRPIEDSPFRIGFSIHTPTWYRLTDENGCQLQVDYSSFGCRETAPWYNSGYFDYKYQTPWKFDVSLGHTIGKNLAFGLEYEYCDISSARFSSIDPGDRETVGDYNYLNESTQQMFKGQHTFKAGMEYKPSSNWSLRLGYNYVSSPYNMDCFKSISYNGNQTETDWTNWKDINRFCGGLGYRSNNGVYFDIAYQYQMQSGDFYAFDDYHEIGGKMAYLPATEIKNNRSQLIATFGFRF